MWKLQNLQNLQETTKPNKQGLEKFFKSSKAVTVWRAFLYTIERSFG